MTKIFKSYHSMQIICNSFLCFCFPHKLNGIYHPKTTKSFYYKWQIKIYEENHSLTCAFKLRKLTLRDKLNRNYKKNINRIGNICVSLLKNHYLITQQYQIQSTMISKRDNKIEQPTIYPWIMSNKLFLWDI